MTTRRTAASRPAIDAALAGRLVDTQFPRWSALPLRLLDPAGSDHVILRLGAELSVRLPRHAGAAGRAAKESGWLPCSPRSCRRPSRCRWQWASPPSAIRGRGRCPAGWTAGWRPPRNWPGRPGPPVRLAEFLLALQRFVPGNVPAGAARGDLTAGSPADRDRATRAAIARTGGVFDATAMTRLWDAALDAPGGERPPVWFHGDFHTGKVLTVDGRLSAVLDFGRLGVGDPARDPTIAFTLMSAGSRTVFREALGVDDATWRRGRGWAPATGLNASTSYAAVSPRVAAQTTRRITAALTG